MDFVHGQSSLRGRIYRLEGHTPNLLTGIFPQQFQRQNCDVPSLYGRNPQSSLRLAAKVFHISAIFRVQSSPKSVWQSSTNYEWVVWKICWKGFEKRRLPPRRRFCSRSWNLSQGDVESYQTCTWARLRDTTLLFAISFWFSIESYLQTNYDDMMI